MVGHMTDAEVIDWLETRLLFIHEASIARLPFELAWLNKNGIQRIMRGLGLRDCVLRAIKEDALLSDER